MMTSAYPIGAPDAVTLPLRVTGSCAAAQFGVAAHTPAANKRKAKTEKRMKPPRWTVHLRAATIFRIYHTEGRLARSTVSSCAALLRHDHSFERDRAGWDDAGCHR